jgi:hypothetical protein
MKNPILAAIEKLDNESAMLIEELDQLDGEDAHKKADNILLNILKQLGFVETVAEFNKLDRWYS